ncbi:MAG TPA: NAD(P)/FAD-dependent oxidoreductase [Thermoplasmata archaeon]|nr:NAD(P)/FAD-dependent oxidoreductase [Thermoplasmata archaeon]
MRSGSSWDAIVIGGGHNGLVTAAYLARAGKRVLVLERRGIVGGATITEEHYPGFKFTVLSYVSSMLRPEVIRELNLPAFGFKVIPQECNFIPGLDGRYLFYRGDEEDTHNAVLKFSKRDAEALPRFDALMARMCKFIQPMLNMTPPDITSLNPNELRKLLKLAAPLRELTEEEVCEFARLMTMSAADYLDEWFELDLLKAGLAASGVIGTFLGPRSPGTAYVLLHHSFGELDGAYRSWGYVRGGTGAVAQAMADSARSFGAQIRVNAEVRQILVRNGRAIGVELMGGEKLHARVIASNADPKRTFLQMLEPSSLPESFVRSVRNFNIEGSSGKVNLAMSDAPDFKVLPGHGPHLTGDVTIGPSVDYIEKAYEDAKYGDFSHRPYIDMCMPSFLDPTMAPPGKHIMSNFVQYAPYHLKNGTWPERREEFGDTVVDTLEEHIPKIRDIILYRMVVTPWDIEQEYGLTGGNIFHGELAPYQLLFFRPAPGWAKYRTPIKGLYLCGSGAHPGGGIMGAPGRNAAREILRDWARLRV